MSACVMTLKLSCEQIWTVISAIPTEHVCLFIYLYIYFLHVLFQYLFPNMVIP